MSHCVLKTTRAPGTKPKNLSSVMSTLQIEFDGQHGDGVLDQLDLALEGLAVLGGVVVTVGADRDGIEPVVRFFLGELHQGAKRLYVGVVEAKKDAGFGHWFFLSGVL